MGPGCEHVWGCFVFCCDALPKTAASPAPSAQQQRPLAPFCNRPETREGRPRAHTQSAAAVQKLPNGSCVTQTSSFVVGGHQL